MTMNRDEFVRLSKANFDERIALSGKKSHDYATEDVLSNFKRVSEMATLLNIKLTPEQYSLFMVVNKLDRICNLLFRDKTPLNESLRDSFLDIMNYIDLTYALVSEKNETKK